MEYKDYKLENVCEYVKERIPIEKVTLENYISTENLLPEKGGKQIASSLPKAKTVVSYQKGDTLISNIRPYFKKIWFSNTDGGSSGDVLVFRANKKINEMYLYYFLSQNEIFNYMVQTSKGTKMPRGDKEALMQYPIKLPVLEYQKKVSDIFSSIDNKIELNNSIISNLEELAQTLFKCWFVDFEFPNENGEPYKSSGGKMVESELGMIPEGWSAGTLNDIGTVVAGGTPSRKVNEYFVKAGFSWITPKDLSVDQSIFKYKGAIDITKEALQKSSAKLHPKNTVLFSSRAPIGYVAIAGQAVSTNQGFKSIIPYNNFSSEYIYLLLKHLTPVIESNAGGSTFKEISGKGMKLIKTVIPTEIILNKFYNIVHSFFEVIKVRENENKNLIELRDTLLPKLLSGEIELPETQEVTDNVPIS